MMRKSRKYIFPVFWLIVMLGMIAVIFDLRWLDISTKPLLMPALIAAVFYFKPDSNERLKILAGLFFAFLGDIFLLAESKTPIFFIAGLVCFLLTHIFYILYFSQVKKAGPSLVKKYPWLPLAILLYSGSLVYFLWPYLGAMRAPVSIYALVISIMIYYSLSLPFSLYRNLRQLFIIGAFFFAFSDSMLAITKFYKPFPTGDFFIRLTYCIAQYCIVRGFIEKRY